MDKKSVLIIGGTGYLGYHICRELVARGYLVTALSIDNVPEGFLPPEVTVIKTDINNLTNHELTDYFTGHDYFIFAAGADDRLTPKAPAHEFFYRANVESIDKLLNVAKKVGVKKAVVLNSYFAYFNRHWPEMHLSAKHPYIRSRKEQQEKAFEVAGDSMPVAIMELPYIVGVTPTKGSLWAGLIKYVNNGGSTKYYTHGGTAVVSVRNVGLAVANALELTTKNTIYQVVDVNLSWEEWLKELRADKSKDIKVKYIPNWLVKSAAWFLKLSHKLKGVESGLDIVPFIDLQTRNTFLPLEESKTALHYDKYNIEEDFTDTIQMVLQKK